MLSQEQQRENGGINFDNCINLGNDEDDEENDEDDDEDDDDDNQEMHPVLTRSLPASARGGGGGRGGGRGSGRGQGGGGAGVMTISLSNNQKMAFKNSADATSREVEADVAVSPSLTSGAISTTLSTASSALGASGVGSRSLTVFNCSAPSLPSAAVNLQQRAQEEEGRGEIKPQGE